MGSRNPNERYKWIIEFSENNNEQISTSNEFFVYSYIETFGLSYTVSKKGVVKCQQLSRDLNCMVEIGMLDRASEKNSEKLVNKGYAPWSYIFTVSEYAFEII